MAQKAQTYCIAGAGIAGLTLALALAKLGAQVLVLERNPHIQEMGAGLQISPNTSKILTDLGLGEALATHAMQPEGIHIFPFRAKKPLTTLALGDEATHRYGAPYYVMHRADLVEMLYAASRRFANIDVQFSVPDFNVAKDEKGLTVSFETGGRAEKRRISAFIGADGVASPTRTKLLSGPKIINSDYTAWRTLIPMTQLTSQFSAHHTSLIWTPFCHAVIYPMQARKQFNVALFTKRSAQDIAPQLPEIAQKDQRLDAILSSATDWTFWPLGMVKTQVWHKGEIAIIGDAAHAMLPFQAQGAAMAIEDAMCLAQNLATAPTPAAAFAKYCEQRQTRVAKISEISEKNGAVFHMTPPLSIARDLVVRLQGPRGHFKRLDWIYNYEIPAA
jgi:salicylate hydroxylase